jgi:DNA-binding NarL/FixJ family response regulator
MNATETYPTFKGRLLVADDEPVFLESITELLRAENYEVASAPDAATCHRLLAEYTFDVLIADIRMPGNSQLELLNGMGAHRQPPPVILMTGYPTIGSAIQAIKLPVTAYLVKPFDFGRLLMEVESAMVGARPAASLPGPAHYPTHRLAADADPLIRHVVAANPAITPEQLAEVEDLSRREREVLWTVLKCGQLQDVAQELKISPHTVRNHLKAIHRKLGVRSRAELLIRFGPVR